MTRSTQKAFYREYRAPAKDLDGREMCAASPVQVECSPGSIPAAHKRQAHSKEQRQPPGEPQDHKLKAHAIHNSELMAASDCENIGGFCAPDKQLESDKNEPRAGRARAQGAKYGHCISAGARFEERAPLQRLNGPVSQTELADGKVHKVPQHEGNVSTEEFRARRVRQMQAANEELVKSSDVQKKPASRETQQAAPQVKTTHFQVPGLAGVLGSQPSTEALLRAVKAQQQLQDKQRSEQVAAPHRSASVPNKGSGSQAKKLVYTLHSPSMEPDELGQDTTKFQGGRPHSQPPRAPESAKPADIGAKGHTHGQPMQQSDSAADGTVADKIPRKVAALARGFEAWAGTSSPSKVPDSGPSSPQRAPAAATAQQTPPAVNYQSYAMGTSSGRKLWPPFLIPPERKGSPCPGSAEPRQVEPEVDTASAAPPRVIRALSFQSAVLEGPQQATADVHHATVAVQPCPPSTASQPDENLRQDDASPKAQGSLPRADTDKQHSKVTTPFPQATGTSVPEKQPAPCPVAATGTVPSRPAPAALPPPISAQAVKRMGPPQATVKAFGSPFKQRDAHETVSISSCNVNMASPTGGSGAQTTSVEWQSKYSKEERPITPRAALDTHKDTAGSKQRPVEEAVGVGPSVPQQQCHDSELQLATHPAAHTGGGSLLMQRASDAATSPVDSFWRPLKKALTPQPIDPQSHREQQTLLAPDGSPADPAFMELEMGALKQDQGAPPFSLSRHNSESASENSRRRTGSSSRDPELRIQSSAESSRLQPAASRGALESSAAHMKTNSTFEEPFVDLLGVQVSSAYLKASAGGGSAQSKCCGCTIM